jgi:hypothetical protein
MTPLEALDALFEHTYARAFRLLDVFALLADRATGVRLLAPFVGVAR